MSNIDNSPEVFSIPNHLTVTDGSAASSTPYIDAVELHCRQSSGTTYALPAHQSRPIFANGAILFSEEVTRRDLAATPDLHVARKILDKKISGLYGGVSSILTSGGSGANRIALRSLLPRGDAASFEILVARGVHTSILAALTSIPRAWPRYITLQRDAHGMFLPVTSAEVALYLEHYPQAQAVIICSPTIAGLCADVQGIAKVIHKHNKKMHASVTLHVDQAWGSHFPLSPLLPKTALLAGADTFATSLHKNIDGALTQLSVVGIAEKHQDLLLRSRIIAATEESTSPSSLLLMSADAATGTSRTERESRIARIIADVHALQQRLAFIHSVHVLETHYVYNDTSFVVDPTKLTFRIEGISGFQTLQQLTLNGLELLIHEGDYVSAHFTAAISEAESERICAVIQRTAQSFSISKATSSINAQRDEDSMLHWFPDAPQVISPHATLYESDIEQIVLEHAAGRICAHPIIPIPPGIAIVTYGQEITPEIINAARLWQRRGTTMRGIDQQNMITVTKAGDSLMPLVNRLHNLIHHISGE